MVGWLVRSFVVICQNYTYTSLILMKFGTTDVQRRYVPKISIEVKAFVSCTTARPTRHGDDKTDKKYFRL